MTLTTDQPYADLGLQAEEYERICALLGRLPTDAELAAVTAVLLALPPAPPHVSPSPRPDGWRSRTRILRSWPERTPAWRRSARS